MDKLLVNVDGSSQGNPGDAAIGVVITNKEGDVVEEISQEIGRATNNVAEYKALIAACEAALNYTPSEAIFFTDSQLLANQINGVYRIRQPHLERLNQIVRGLLAQLPCWKVRYIERSANWKAHRLAQRALLNRHGGREREISERIKEKVEELDDDDKRKVLEYVNKLLESQKLS